MKSLQSNNQPQTQLAKLDNNNSLASSQITEIAQVLTTLSSVRTNNSTPEQILAASALIAKEYPKLTIGELQQIIIDGIMQKYNKSDQPQYNDIPSLLFWLRRYKIDNIKVFW